MGQGSQLTRQVSSRSKNYAANTAGDQIVTGPGTLTGINVNTAGLTSSVTLYDGTSTAGKKLGAWSTLALRETVLNLSYSTGLFAVVAGGTPADITVAYR